MTDTSMYGTGFCLALWGLRFARESHRHGLILQLSISLPALACNLHNMALHEFILRWIFHGILAACAAFLCNFRWQLYTI